MCRRLRPSHAAILVAALLSACSPAPQTAPDAEPAPAASVAAPVDGLQAQVDQTLAEHDLIALGVVVASKDEIIDIAVSGKRARNGDAPVQINDHWHIGSNTKALTALLYAQLVEQDLTEWGATLPELFPGLAADMDPAWTDVTIEDLFAHRSGLPQKGGFWLNARRNDERPVAEQRLEAARETLNAPPSKPRDAFDYNNLNYIIAGAAMEVILRSDETLPDTWEAAMQALIFDRLPDENLRGGFGYGPPPSGLQGHRSLFGAFPTAIGRGKTADNPAVLGPAGTLHATLPSHAALGREFLKDESVLITPAMRDKLFTPHPDPSDGYAMGWGVYEDDQFGTLYLHNGSNTFWLSSIVIAPKMDRVVIVNVNQFSEGAQIASRDLTRALLEEAMTGPDQ